eukprot:gnl/Chilomastix_cuspidata/1113.p1 GENE.gnl/Chilomastix_cuspidata/1113~~gnl/Chilomastix_cuspidata/1113.p1  ORF type:complete len:788 (-),score=337.22 gnl/Chilomastix_cuspidata/1113:335-2698(-)
MPRAHPLPAGAFVLALVLALARCDADPCIFVAYTTTTYSEVMSCLETINDDTATVQSQTIDAVLGYLNASVYTDYYLDQSLSHGFTYIDIAARVEALRDETFSNEYEFHTHLSAEMRRLKDPNFVYRSPFCFSLFTAVLPFSFGSRVDNGEQVVYLQHLPVALGFAEREFMELDTATALRLQQLVSKHTPLEQIRVTYPNGTVLEGAPVDVISAWADAEADFSKNAVSRFNRALKWDFFVRDFRYGLPESQVSIVVGDEVLDMPWLIFTEQSVGSSADLLTFCPLGDPFAWMNDEGKFALEAQRNTELSVMSLLPSSAAFEPATALPSASADTITSTLRRLYRGSFISLFHFEHKDGDQAHILSVNSDADSDADDVIAELQDAFTALAALSALDTFVLDVTNFAGGDNKVATTVFYYLFPELDRPSSGNNMRRVSDVTDEFLECGFLNDYVLYDFDTHTRENAKHFYTKSQYQSYISFHTPDSSYQLEYVKYYSYYAPDFYAAGGETRTDEGDLFDAAFPYRPEQVLVMTDGLCAGVCGQLVAHMLEFNVGGVIGLGGVFTGGEATELLAAYNSPGTIAYDSRQVEAIWDEYSVDAADKAVPAGMPRNGYFTFPYDGLLSWQNASDALEFKLRTIDFPVPYWLSLTSGGSTDDLLEAMDGVFAYFAEHGRYTAHTFRTNETCNIGNAEASVFGNFWDVDAQAWGECALVYCADGDVVAWDAAAGVPESCVLLEKSKRLYDDFNFWNAFWILFGLIAGTCVIYFVVRLISGVRMKRKIFSEGDRQDLQ